MKRPWWALWHVLMSCLTLHIKAEVSQGGKKVCSMPPAPLWVSLHGSGGCTGHAPAGSHAQAAELSLKGAAEREVFPEGMENQC